MDKIALLPLFILSNSQRNKIVKIKFVGFLFHITCIIQSAKI